MGTAALLDCVGLSGPEEALYLRLLAEPGRTVADLGEGLGIPASLVRARLAALAALGLATEDSMRPGPGPSPEHGRGRHCPDDGPGPHLLHDGSDYRSEYGGTGGTTRYDGHLGHGSGHGGHGPLDVHDTHDAAGGVWRATAPDIALEALVRGREAELVRLRGRVEELMRGYRHGQRAARPEELIEVVSGRESIAACWRSLQSGARGSLRILDKAPHVLVSTPQDEAVVLRRGVRVDVIYEHEAVRDARQLAAIRDCMALGEQSRMLPTLPFKLALVDDRWALLPVSTGTVLDSALVVRRCSLLDALSRLFTLCWSQAMRIPRAQPEQEREPEADPPSRAGAGGGDRAADALAEPLRRRRELLTLLAAGLTDESIARKLGVSTRTVQRLVREFMDSCGARTRFQAGVQAAREELI
ncbi:helix-turn-helix domain-containing protein [Streptacidiphilus neutrinimicus]|uniref:helix-turn-helix domain-containing protein n=1 Tax=Streptacidiphilus neutrinimicus TaxID=105420 RepID=UPI000694943C|nr:helix-turn-helix domain-containing protein [Streptacidiphilus neutrinimicus]